MMIGRRKKAAKPRCGLCGKTENLTKTECCGNWICDDEENHGPPLDARNSCHRNHSRFTLCGYHYNEGHEGDWKTCKQCRSDFEPEMVAYFGTNDFNFEKMPDPPAYEAKKCSKCGKVIVLAQGGYAYGTDGYTCKDCFEKGG